MSLVPHFASPADAMFLIPESREQPMHVGSLQLFTTPDGAGPDFLSDLYQQALAVADVAPVFRKRPVRSLATLGQWTWVQDDAIDLEHHVRHSSLPRPGRIRELLALTSRLHGTLLDRKRPLWETHLIEGLEDGRFAVYTKLHHALMDGVSGLKLLERSLSTEPDARDVAMPFAARPQRPRGSSFDPLGALASGVRAVGEVVALAPRVAHLAEQALRQQGAAMPGQAPRSILNVPITGSRRFAAESWSLDRIRSLAKAADATVNDVILAMSAGALRDYLLSLDALPDAPLVAMTPVSLRTGDSEDGGNAVGAILASLGTDLADPEERMLAVRESMRQGKASLEGLSPLQITALSAAMMSPLLLNTLLGVSRFVRPPFNLVISNVPGPRETLYWNGSRLDGMYPLSIPTAGQALNITVTSYVDHLQFGLTGDRRSLPHLQRLLAGLEDALCDLEKAFL